MPATNIVAQVIPLTANGLGGTVTISPTAILHPHTKVILYSAGAGRLECIVMAVEPTTGVVSLRPIPTELDLSSGNRAKNMGYGLAGDLSAWTVVGGAVLMVNEQVIAVEALYRAKA